MATIQELEERLDSFEKTLLQMSRNLVPVTSKADDAFNIAEAATPYVESKMVGIQDTECVFTDVEKDGTITANVKTQRGEYLPCTVERTDKRVRVSFKTLTEVATVTIQIQ